MICCAATAQNKFELNKDLGGNSIAYVDTIAADSLSLEDLNMAITRLIEESDFKLEEIPTKTNGRKFEYIMVVEGQKSELGSSYYYRISAEVFVEKIKENISITMTDFKKKSSPGEPGMSLESYIENYEPKISSVKSRERAEQRLDEIEIQIHEFVIELMEELRKEIEKRM